jgi:hypothetical protein
VCKKKFYLSLSTVSWKNKEKILSAFEKNLTTNKKMRKCGFDDVDKALMEWLKLKRDAGFSQVQDAMQTLMNFSENSETVDDSTCNSLRVI